MIKSKPKYQTVFALSVFLILLFGSFFLLLDSLLNNPTYFILKLILTPIVLVIGLLILNKLITGAKVIEIGNNKIKVLYPISRKRVSIEIKDIISWREEVVETKNGDFRETKILYAPKKILKLSNKENSNYEKILKYFHNKMKKQKVN